MYSFLLLLLSLAAVASYHTETLQKKVIVTEIFFNFCTHIKFSTIICKLELIFMLDYTSHMIPINKN